MWERRHWCADVWEPVDDSEVPDEIVWRMNLWAKNGIPCDQIPATAPGAPWDWYRFVFCV